MSTGIHQNFSPTMRLPSHKDTGIRAVATREANKGVKHGVGEASQPTEQASQQSKPANRALRSGNDIPTSLTPTELRSADTQLLLLLRACL